MNVEYWFFGLRLLKVNFTIHMYGSLISYSGKFVVVSMKFYFNHPIVTELVETGTSYWAAKINETGGLSSCACNRL